MSDINVVGVTEFYPGVATLELSRVPDCPLEWTEMLPDLTAEHLGSVGSELRPVQGGGGARTSMLRPADLEPPRLNDCIPHSDLTITGNGIGHVVTGIVGVEVSDDAPGLTIIDTHALLEATIAQGIFEEYGITRDKLLQLEGLMAFSAFKRTYNRLQTDPQVQALEPSAIFDAIVQRFIPDDGDYPDSVAVPLIELNPFCDEADERRLGLCIDAERMHRIISANGQQLPRELLVSLLEFVRDTRDPLIKQTIRYRAGQAVLFSKAGTIHSIERPAHRPGTTRVVHIGRIAMYPEVHEKAIALANAA